MQKIFIHIGAIITALALSLWVVQPLTVFATEVDIDADGNILDVRGVPELPANVSGSTKVSSLDEDMMDDIIYKAITFYFPSLTGYAKTCATATLSAALKLYKEKKDGDINGLQYYLKSVALSMRSLVAAGGGQSYMQFRSAGDILVTLNEALAAEGVVDGVIDWDKFVSDTALTATRNFIDPTSGEEKTETRPVTGDDISMTGDVFREYVESENTTNAPKSQGLWKCSYRTDKVIHTNYETDFITIWGSATGTPFSGEVFIYPFYTDHNGITYYSDYQYRLYFDDLILGDITDYGLYVETFKYLDGVGFVLQSDYSGLVLQGNVMDKPYTIALGDPFYFTSYKPHLEASFYMSLSNYYNDKRYYNAKLNGGGLFTLPSEASKFYSGSTEILLTSSSGFALKYSDFYYYDDDGNVVVDADRTDIDTGFICCTDLITREYSDIDTSKIPDNYYIGTTGDTIYNYTITNPETGQSDTITNYVTNNYTYITNNNGNSGDGSGVGGSVGCNITVDGKVDVGGSVAVDVNVNLNGGGTSGNGTSYGDINTDPLDDYLNSALDESSEVRSFLGDFFSFLPEEFLVLLGIGLTVVILGRIMGR